MTVSFRMKTTFCQWNMNSFNSYGKSVLSVPYMSHLQFT